MFVKFRGREGEICGDNSARLVLLNNEFFLKSAPLCEFLAGTNPDPDQFILFFLEGTETDARCIVSITNQSFFGAIEREDPTLRLFAYDLPPETATCVDSGSPLAAMYRALAEEDAELFGTHANKFLDAPHILIPLFAHSMSLRSEDNINFTIQLKKLGEQIRGLLLQHGRTARIETVPRSHLELWAEVQNWRISFLDGGVARIPSIAGMEPIAIRVGVYSVRPGVRQPSERELWSMQPFVVRDLLDPSTLSDQTDRRRLQEAARYVAEPLQALAHVDAHPDTRVCFLHGPLINQFLMYDEGEPNYIPSLSSSFLSKFGITAETVQAKLRDVPLSPRGAPLWNQFMAVYGYITQAVCEHKVPVIGVVERSAGRSLANAVLRSLEQDRVIDQAYVRSAQEILERYDITDEFLFGCILREGEYVTPLKLEKNLERRARPSWQLVVRQYASPFGTMLKSEDSRFPFRVELNDSGVAQSAVMLRLVYHTAKLLPQYAFPVGLDIADRYAKVPDWISRGISAQLSARVLKAALRTGDPNLVAQVRQFLARGPRDFFFRPGLEI